MKELDKNIVEAIIRTAVIENHYDELKQLNEDSRPVSFSEEHKKHMNRLFAKARTKRAAVRVWIFARKTATVAAFAIAVFSSLLFINPKVQATVAEVIAEFFSGFTSFRFNSEKETTENIEWELRWLPDSFSEIYREYDAGVSRLGYRNKDGVTIRFTATPAESNQINVDNENAVYSIKTTDGINYHIFISTAEEAPSVIIWVNQGYDFIISAHCDIEILEMIAYSVHETNK